MATDTAQRIRDIFEAVIAAPTMDRVKVLDEQCRGDASLRAEVESLIEHDTEVPVDFMRPQVQRCDEAIAPPTIDPRIGTTVGQFEILDVIASGGMGTVYLAIQKIPKREVALKIISPSAVTRISLKRFENEARVLGRLEHAHIAQVYDAGSFADPSLGGTRVPYFAMQHVQDARTLLQYAAERKLDLEARLQLFIQLCEGIHHGHQRGIIHRDIKPNNILVDSSGNVKVIDFGVARSIDSDVTLATMQTDTGMLIGTLQYMSPEQCICDADDLDIRTDVYSLGAVLYELLTERRPYNTSGTTLIEATRIIREASPRRPSQMNTELRGDIETIILKALEKDRDRRYSSVLVLREDVEHYLKNEPITARPPSNAYLISKFVQRNKWQTIAGVAITLTLLSIGVGSLVLQSYHRATIQRQKAEATAYGAQISAAHVAIQSADIGAARTILSRLDEGHRGWEWRFLYGQLDQSVKTLFDARAVLNNELHAGQFATNGAPSTKGTRSTSIECLAVSKDESRIAVGLNHPTRIRILKVDGSVEFAGLPWVDETLLRIPQAVALSHDGRLLAVAVIYPDDDITKNTLQVWDLDAQPTPRLVVEFNDVKAFVAADFHPNRYALAAGIDFQNKTGIVKVWDIEPLLSDARHVELHIQPSATFLGHAEMIGDISFSPNGELLATASNDYTVRLWDVRAALSDHADRDGSGRHELAVLRGHEFHVNSVSFSPEGRRLASASVDGTAILWDVAESIRQAQENTLESNHDLLPGVQIDRLVGHDGDVLDVTFNALGNRVITSGNDQTIRIWDVDENARVSNANRSQDWVAPRPKLINTLRGHEDRVNVLETLRDGRLLSGSFDGSIKLWDTDVVGIPQLLGHGTSVTRVEITPDGSYYVTSGNDESVIVWQADTLVPTDVRFMPAGVGPLDIRSWTSSGQLFLAACGGLPNQTQPGSVQIWKVSKEGKLAKYRKLTPESDHREEFRSLAISPDGSRLAAGDASGTVRVWNIEDQESITPIRTFDVGDRSVGAMEFLDDAGDWLVVGNGRRAWLNNERLLQLWSVISDSDQPQEDLSDGQGVVTALAVDSHTVANGKVQQLANGSADQSITLWNIEWNGETPHLVHNQALLGHTDFVCALAFHPTEPRLISGSGDQTLKLWDLVTYTQAASFREQAGDVSGIAVSPTGDTILTSSSGIHGSDNVARVWYAPPSGQPSSVTTNLRMKQADHLRAHKLVYDLGRSAVPSLREMKRRIKEDIPLPAEVRNIALEHFDNLLPQPWHIAQHAKNILANPNATLSDLEAAKEWIQAAKRIDPENAEHDPVMDQILDRLKPH
jgi:WD40 repeat protein/serine/threonine protein kinase